MRKTIGLASILALAFTGTALAEGPQDPNQPPPQQMQPQPYQQQQQPYGQPPQQGGVQVVEQQQQPPDQRPSRGLEYGGHITVPIYITQPSDNNMQLGLGIQGRVGWEFGNVTTELNIGYQFNGFADIKDAAITNFWVGAGIRYSIFNPSALVPFVGAGLGLNFWAVSVCGDDGFGGTVCADSDRKATVSFNALVAAAYEISPEIALEGGVQINYSLHGDVFTDNVTWVDPFIGGTLYF